MAKIKKITFGQVREIPVDAAESRIVPFVLSTPERDRHRTILSQANWMLDNYRKNPVVGYMHNLYGDLCNSPDPDDVIGQSKSVATEDVSGAICLVGSGLFDPADVNLKADKIFRKLLLGTLRAVSVGFLSTGKGKWGQGEEAEGRDHETYYFAGQELLEWSVVNIPSNAGSGKRDMGFMRSNTQAALMYTIRELGKNYRLSQIENFRVRDVLDLLEGKDIEIRETDPDKVREMLKEEMAQKDLNDRIEAQQVEVRKRILAG